MPPDCFVVDVCEIPCVFTFGFTSTCDSDAERRYILHEANVNENV